MTRWVAGAALAALIGPGIPAQSRYPVRREETVSRTLGVGAGRRLEVSTTSGSIRVSGYDGDAVEAACVAG